MIISGIRVRRRLAAGVNLNNFDFLHIIRGTIGPTLFKFNQYLRRI